MSGFGFDYLQGFAGNQQQPNQPNQPGHQAAGYIPMDYYNINSGPVYHEQTVSNWPIDQAQPFMDPTSVLPVAYNAPYDSYGWQMQTAAPRHIQSSTMPMEQAQSMQPNGMFTGHIQSGMLNMGQMPTDQMQGAVNMEQAQNPYLFQNVYFTAQPTSTQNSSLQTPSMQQTPNMQYSGMQQTPSMQYSDMQQTPSMQHPGMQQTPSMQYSGMQQTPSMQHSDMQQTPSMQYSDMQQTPSMQYSGMQQTPGMQPTQMQPLQQQSRNRSRNSTAKIMQGGRKSGHGKYPPHRPVEVIDAMIKKTQAKGRVFEGNKPALSWIGTELAQLRKERLKSVQAERTRILRENQEAALARQRRSQEPVDHVESSATPKRQKRAAAAAAAAAKETPPELSPGESCHASTFTPDVNTNQTSPATPFGASGHGFTVSPAHEPLCINPSLLSITTTITAEPVQQQSSTNGGKLLPGAVAINPSAAAVPRTVSIPQQTRTNSLMLPAGAVFVNPSSSSAAAAGTTTTATPPSAATVPSTVPTPQKTRTNSLMLPPGAVFIDLSSSSAAAATTAATTTAAAAAAATAAAATTAAAAATTAAAETPADATANAAENAADWLALDPILQFLNSTENADEQAMLPEADCAVNNEENLPPMDPDADLFGDEHMSSTDQNDELLGTEEWLPGQQFSDLFAEIIQSR